MKFNIIICEDVKTTLSKITSVVYSFFESSIYDISCYQLSSGFERTVEYAKSGDGVRNIYLLDINLSDEINGLNLAQQIREYDYLGYIIFITSHTELGMKALSYKLKILDFIDKSDENFKNRLLGCFDTIVKECSALTSTGEYITIKTGTDLYRVYLNEIIYIETDSVGRKIIIHTHNKTIESYMVLKDVEKLLGDGFFRCHRAVVVNISKITRICSERGNMHLELTGKNICPLSNRKAKELINIASSVNK